ncbi:RDD family protein [Stenoxybacter acetivorans]|uniref:RDD family protein n=1 Tax=Stenoxybacter acetivorans TaxID=422441 RepID=UPI0009FDA4D2|nr:RDD family protein [Stenoxybacter acetivorans]
MTLPISLPEPEQELEVELASPGARIGAFILNYAILVVVCAAIILSVVPSPSTGVNGKSAVLLATIAIVAFVGLIIWQCVWMSRHGQSIGKRIVGIKVIKLNGENPGFVGNVLLREIVYYLIIGVILGIIGVIFFNGFDTESSILNGLANIPYMICLVMLFQTKTWRRTLQDYLAGTLVVKAEKNR